MKLSYSPEALADLEEIANYYSINASPAIAESGADFAMLLTAFATCLIQLPASRASI